MDLEERRLALEARRLAKEERVEDSKMLADEERILSIDLDTCKPSMRLFYKAQQERIMAKYSAPPSCVHVDVVELSDCYLFQLA